MKNKVITSVVLFLSFSLAISQDFAPQSLLRKGDWVKICASEEGIYKIDFNFFEKFGLDKSNAKNIRLFGYGNGMLPQKNNEPRHDDLLETAFYGEGLSDNTFDKEDFLLFYMQSVNRLYLDNDKINVETNIYADEACYFITVDKDSSSLLIEKKDFSSQLITIPVTNANEVLFLENNETNLLHSGRNWIEEPFVHGQTKKYTFRTPDIVKNSSVNIDLDVVGMSELSQTSFTLTVLDSILSAQPLVAKSRSEYGRKGTQNYFSYQLKSNQEKLDLLIQYDGLGNSSSFMSVDKIRINYQSQLTFDGVSPRVFSNIQEIESGYDKYYLKSASQADFLWDISSSVPVAYALKYEGGFMEVVAPIKQFGRFVVFNKSMARTDFQAQKISNQNLHGISNIPNLLIITTKMFEDEALRLQQLRENNQGYEVLAVNVEDIYNEFSSGRQDISAIRDFIRMLYTRDAGAGKLKYVLLFGDCSYDYKNRLTGNTNYVPIYEARESFDNIRSFSSDDFFVLLEDEEGYWEESTLAKETMDLAIGRIPVASEEDAKNVVDKLIAYEDSKSIYFGAWKSRLCYVADDDNNKLHSYQADTLALRIEKSYPYIKVKRVFLDAYVQKEIAGQILVPDGSKALDEAIKEGTLIMNYNGHGGESGWAEEQILSIPQFQKWKNKDRLSFFMTATCEFGRYDDPIQKSAAELLLLQAETGGIGLETTTRPVYASSNFVLSKEFYSYAFTQDATGRYHTVGEIHLHTKNNSISGTNNRNFSLLGDPSMTLAYPSNYIKVDSSFAIDTLKALEERVIKGTIQSHVGELLTSFNGYLTLQVFDKNHKINTYGEEIVNGKPAVYSFEDEGSLVFENEVKVVNGIFSAKILLSRDIAYHFGEGKIRMYAYQDDYSTDAVGVETVAIGGVVGNVLVNLSNNIDYKINDDPFVQKMTTDKNVDLFIRINEEDGINLALSDIGHEMILALDNGDQIVVNSLFELDSNSFTSGILHYNFTDLTNGAHFIVFRYWDNKNHSTTDTLHFNVGDAFSIEAKPSLFKEETKIVFKHHRVGTPVKLDVKIYDINGILVFERNNYQEISNNTIEEFVWDGRNSSGSEIYGSFYVHTEMYFQEDDKRLSRIIKIVRLK